MVDQPQSAAQPTPHDLIKTLFAQLTKLVIGSVTNTKIGNEMMNVVVQWATMALATIIVMLSKKHGESKVMASKVTLMFGINLRQQIEQIQKMAQEQGKETESRIITS